MAWHGLDEQVERIVNRLKPIGSQIGAAAKDGDALAARVIANYQMLHRRVDPVAAMLTETALDEWLKSRNKQGNANGIFHTKRAGMRRNPSRSARPHSGIRPPDG